MKVRGTTPPWLTLVDLVRDRGASLGERVALEIDGEKATYAWLEVASGRIAAHLHALGIGKGDRVCSLMGNRLEQVLLWFGANRIGAIWAPLNSALVGADLALTLQDTGAKLLVAEADLLPALAAVPDAVLASMHRYVAGRAPAACGFTPFGALLEPGPAAPEVTIDPRDPCTIIYTGGTTGRPKGVMLPHFAYIVSGYRYRENLSLTASDRYYTVMQLFHIGAQDGAVLCSLMWDIPGFIDRKFSASGFFERTRETRATVIDPVGTMLTFLCNQPPSPLDREHAVRITMDSSGQIPAHIPAEFSRRFGIPLCASYAQTENGGGYLVTCPPGDRYRPRALGKPWGWAELAVLNEYDEPLAPGEVGEIALRPTIPYSFMLGYHGAPEKTLHTLRNGWLHTGDLGQLDQDGYLWFAGRHAHWIRRRGENISAYEVEFMLSEHPDVREVCVVGVPSEHGEEEVKAFVIPRPEARIEPRDIAEWARGRMAAFKLPRFVELIDDFPRSLAKREIERHRLRALPNGSAWDRDA